MRRIIWGSMVFVLAVSASRAAPTESEDMNTLNQLFGDRVARADVLLDAAAKLTASAAVAGETLSNEACAQLEQKISRNYRLHTSADDDNPGRTRRGVRVCPRAKAPVEIFGGQSILGPSVALSLSKVAGVNALGVKSNSTLSVSYQLADARTQVHQRYALDAAGKIVEFEERREFAGRAYWSTVAALDAQGNALADVQETWPRRDEPYIFKRALRVIPARGDGAFAYRHTQNDGRGVEVELSNYAVPHQFRWDHYEVSPLLWIGGLYQARGAVLSSPPSLLRIENYRKGALRCASGYEGFDAQGNLLRRYGSADCREQMDIVTIRP